MLNWYEASILLLGGVCLMWRRRFFSPLPTCDVFYLGVKWNAPFLVRPPFEKPHLIELNYFLTSFHIRIRGEEEAFFKTLSPPASTHGSSLCVPWLTAEHPNWRRRQRSAVINSALLCCLPAVSYFVHIWWLHILHDSSVSKFHN